MNDDPIAPAPVDHAMIQELIASGRDFQLSLVEDDRELSWAEYERLFSTLRQCVAERGGQLEEPRLLAGDVYEFAVGAPRDSESFECLIELWEPLGPHWSFYHRPTEAELLAANVALADCLRARGVVIDAEQPLAEDFRSLGGLTLWLTEPFADCSHTVAIEHGMPTGFAGY